MICASLSTTLDLLPSLEEHRVNSAPRCSGHAGGMTDPMLGWGWVGPWHARHSLAGQPTPGPSLPGRGEALKIRGRKRATRC